MMQAEIVKDERHKEAVLFSKEVAKRETLILRWLANGYAVTVLPQDGREAWTKYE